MPDLFPTVGVTSSTYVDEMASDKINYGKTVQFDFEKHEFILSPTGKQKTVTGSNAWAEWCVKALSSERYKYLIYSDNYGEEIDTLLGKSYPKKVIESEIKRMVKDCLLADKRTASVDDFNFTWIDDGIIFSCSVKNIIGENITISRTVVRQ